jgi:hypothetical protein
MRSAGWVVFLGLSPTLTGGPSTKNHAVQHRMRFPDSEIPGSKLVCSSSLVKRAPDARRQPRLPTTRSWLGSQRGCPLSNPGLVPGLLTGVGVATRFAGQSLPCSTQPFSPAALRRSEVCLLGQTRGS